MGKIRLGLNRTVAVVEGSVKIVSGSFKLDCRLEDINRMYVERRFFKGWCLMIDTGSRTKAIKFGSRSKATKALEFIQSFSK